MSFKKILKEERDKLGWSQAKLAKACGWKGPSRISNYEAGIREPSLDDIRVLAKALNVIPQELIKGELGIPENISNTNLSMPLYSWENLSKSKEEPEIIISKIAPFDSYALRVEDSDMINRTEPSPTFPPGTIIVVNPGADYKINDFVIVRHKEKGTLLFRKVEKYGLDIMLVPLNSVANIYYINDFYIVGVVVASMNLELNR